MALPYVNNGPRSGRGNGRFNDTLVHGASKKTPAGPLQGPVAPPPVSPTQAIANAGQLSSLQATLAAKLAALTAQRGTIRGQYTMDRAGVRSARIQGQVGAENDALQRGIVGSSSDLGARAGVDATAAQGVQAAIQARVQGMLGLKTERIGAVNDYYTGVYQVQAQAAAQQQEAANQAFMQDLVMRLGDESARPGVNSQTAATGQRPALGTPTTPNGQAMTPEYIKSLIQGYTPA